MEKLKYILIGTPVSITIAVMSFLLVSYFGNFVSKADYNADKVNIAVIKNDIVYLKKGQEEIKAIIRNGH